MARISESDLRSDVSTRDSMDDNISDVPDISETEVFAFVTQFLRVPSRDESSESLTSS